MVQDRAVVEYGLVTVCYQKREYVHHILRSLITYTV